MEIGAFAQLHVEYENKWKIWKIKNTYIGHRYMANKYTIPNQQQVKPFIVDIFGTELYICFVNKKNSSDYFIKKIKFPRSKRKEVIKYISNMKTQNLSAITIHSYSKMPVADPPIL